MVARRRRNVDTSVTIKEKTGCGNIFCTIVENGDKTVKNVFCRLGKAGVCGSTWSESLGRMITVAIRSGADLKEIIKELKGIQCERANGFGDDKFLSCADSIGKALEWWGIDKGILTAPKDYSEKPSVKVTTIKPETKTKTITEEDIIGASCCPDCGSTLKHESGCEMCTNSACGYSRCG